MQLIRRILAVVALCGLVPLAWTVVTGRTSLAAAGLRAVVLLVVVLVLHRVLTRAVLLFADTLDGRWRGERHDADEGAPTDTDAEAVSPRRG